MTTTLAFALRDARPADAEFEQFLYASTREDLRPLGDEVFEGLIGMQFRAQSMAIRLDHPNAQRQIVMVDKSPVGRLVVDLSGAQVELLDLAVLPDFRNHGIGTGVLRGVCAQADRLNRAVRLLVEKQSRSVRLFERLGFVVRGDEGMYLAMMRG
jgi:ribosomal protein S18 acetylase RimI-like enzyme